MDGLQPTQQAASAVQAAAEQSLVTQLC